MDNLTHYSSLSDSQLVRYNTYPHGEDLPALRYIKTPRVVSILTKMLFLGFLGGRQCGNKDSRGQRTGSRRNSSKIMIQKPTP